MAANSKNENYLDEQLVFISVILHEIGERHYIKLNKFVRKGKKKRKLNKISKLK